jgi:hypothetical protein
VTRERAKTRGDDTRDDTRACNREKADPRSRAISTRRHSAWRALISRSSLSMTSRDEYHRRSRWIRHRCAPIVERVIPRAPGGRRGGGGGREGGGDANERKTEPGCGGNVKRRRARRRGRGTWKERRDDHPKLVHLHGLSLLFHFPSRARHQAIYVAKPGITTGGSKSFQRSSGRLERTRTARDRPYKSSWTGLILSIRISAFATWDTVNSD